MSRLLQEIQGMQVISLAEGRILGAVQKVYLDPSKKAVSGMLVRQSGMGRSEGWVEVRDVAQIGEDVLFVTKAAAYKAKAPMGRSLKDLMGMPVMSKDGKLLGALVDVEVDEQWRVVELSLSEGRLIQIDPRQSVFGQDTVLLKPGSEQRLRSAPKSKPGFLARMFGAQAIEEAADAIARVERIRKADRRPAEKADKKPTKKPTKKTAKKTKKRTAQKR